MNCGENLVNKKKRVGVLFWQKGKRAGWGKDIYLLNEKCRAGLTENSKRHK